jgi:hypothetical protein
MTPQELQETYLNLIQSKEEIEDKIKDIKQELFQVHLDKKDTFLSRLTVYSIEPRQTVQWKKIAETYNPPDELIKEYSSMSKPSFGIRIRKEK